MILVDASQIIVATAFALKSEIIGKEQKEICDILRHGTLNTLKSFKMKYSKDYGDELILLCDGERYWRKDIYPYYKGDRKQKRDASDMPWDMIHESKKQLIDEFKTVLPYRVLHHSKAEADDLFAIMVREVASKRIDETSLFDPESEKVIMISSDGDLKQLHSSTVRQFSPMSNSFVKIEEKNPMEFLKKKILVGDRGDFICNCFSPFGSLHNGVRQKPATEAKMALILKESYETLEDGTDDPEIKERIKLNRKLMSFYEIPKDIIDEVLIEYQKPFKSSRDKFYRYLSSKGCKHLLGEIQKF